MKFIGKFGAENRSSNILIDGHGTRKIGNFGFCKQLPVVEGGKTTFTAQLFARSEGYYPSELSHGQYGPRSDVYSFGIVSTLNINGTQNFLLRTLQNTVLCTIDCLPAPSVSVIQKLYI